MPNIEVVIVRPNLMLHTDYAIEGATEIERDSRALTSNGTIQRETKLLNS